MLYATGPHECPCISSVFKLFSQCVIPIMKLILPLTFFSTYALAALTKRNGTGLTTSVTWDSHSLSIFSQRTFIFSAEVHPWRLPNPDLWVDVFQKIKANGFNTVSFYDNWAVHYPTPDTNRTLGDWEEGTYRDTERFILEAKKAGLWLIARPGPYVSELRVFCGKSMSV